jgi:hypothetical protein
MAATTHGTYSYVPDATDITHWIYQITPQPPQGEGCSRAVGCERFVGSIRRELRDRILIVNGACPQGAV